MITHPRVLFPDSQESVHLPSGREIEVPETRPTFKLWADEFTGDTYGNKLILNVDGEPLFAELAILRAYQKDGWEGVWVETYRGKYRAFWGDDGGVELPPDKMRLLQEIYARAGARTGCFDVFCWNGDSVVFAEFKRSGKDRIRSTQLRWIEAAVDSRLKPESLLIVEWSLESPNETTPEVAPR